MKYITVAIHTDRVGLAAGATGFVVSGSAPADPGAVHELMASVFEALRPDELRITFRARPSAGRQAIEDAAVAAADQFGVTVVYGVRADSRATWLDKRDGTDAEMLEEAERRHFRDDDIAEVEALASFDAVLREEWAEAA